MVNLFKTVWEIHKFINMLHSRFATAKNSASNTGSTDTGIPVLPAFFMIPKYRNTGGSIPVFSVLNI
jgi:hypothetical protein